jgi:hypothetical protein
MLLTCLRLAVLQAPARTTRYLDDSGEAFFAPLKQKDSSR